MIGTSWANSRGNDLGLRRHGTDQDRTAVPANTFKLGNAREVDQIGRLRQAQLHQWHQTMAAGEDTAFLPEAREQADSCGNRRRPMVVERC